MLVKAGAPVESTIDLLMPLLDKGDIIIDGGNEWYENTEHRQKKVAEKGLMYLGMGVSGGEEGARNGEGIAGSAEMVYAVIMCVPVIVHITVVTVTLTHSLLT